MDAIHATVCPALQGGPHYHQIGSLAVALLEAKQTSLENMRYKFSETRGQRGQVLATNGTDNVISYYGMARIATNKNIIAGDISTLNLSDVRLGTPALTTRGLAASS
jgi:glycine hydroxymethyltransferase